MRTTREVKEFDIIILGAGPGGCSTALALSNSGLRVAVIDKNIFPRDKVCGELMHRKAVVTLNKIIPGFEDEFKKYPKTLVMKQTRVHYKGKVLAFNWKNESYTCPRMTLDDYLLGLVKERSATSVFLDTTPDKITRDETGVIITLKGCDTVFKAKLLVGADGAQSIVARQLTDKKLEKEHYLGAVRAYYRNIAGLNSEVSEVFFHTKYEFNYLWMFPVTGGMANVGFGMLSSNISKNKINLKDAFYDHFKQSPELAERFKNAEQVGTLDGFGVPLGSNVGTTSGERFMLIGDAASLSNPLSGTGIGNAVLSGKLAADQAITCFQRNDFSAGIMKEYDESIQNAIINDLIKSYNAQKLLAKMPFILDIVFWVGKFAWVKKYIQSIV